VHYRETLEQALMREVDEETGLLVEIGRPVIINDTIDPLGSRHVVNITFLATVTGGQITDNPQDPRVEGVDLVEVSSLQALDLRPPLAEAITALADCPDAPTVYLGPLFRDAAT